MPRRLLCCLLCCCLLITLLPVWATHAQESTDLFGQTFENIVYLVDGEQITMLVSVGVTRPTVEPLTWLIPVPAEPLSVGFGPADALVEFEYISVPVPERPRSPCQLSQRSSVAGGDIRFPLPVIVGASTYSDVLQDYGVFSGTSEQEIIDAIRAAGFEVTDRMIGAIEFYPPSTYFVVFRATWPDPETYAYYDEARLPLVSVRYPADEVMLSEVDLGLWPLGVSRGARTVWIIGASQYAPAGYPAPVLPRWSLMRGRDHQVRDMGHLVLRQLSSDHAQIDYPRVREISLNFVNGPAFLTEFAGVLEGFLRDTFTSYRQLDDVTQVYITRLRTEFWVDEAPRTTTFVPAPDFPDVPRLIDLNGLVDPIVYDGCSSETALDLTLGRSVPETRTRIDDLWLTVAHPDEWVLSEITWDDQLTLYVLAPEPMTRESIAAFSDGEPAPPFFVAFEQIEPPDPARAQDDYEIDQYWYADAAHDAFAQVFGTDVAGDMRLRYWPYGGDECGLEQAVVYGLFASEADWGAHQKIYDAMLDYAGGYQYFASAGLPHTLFLGGDYRGESPILMIPYPAGWSAQLDADDNVRLMPEDGSVTVIVERNRELPSAWKLRVEGDSAAWASAIDAIRAGITTESACSAR